ncbi:MAG TPA: hypothetical protein VFA83_21570 [Acidimicrobiales bacterium]|nr:hypothetical protein [Acidimicrobiales bacterium]
MRRAALVLALLLTAACGSTVPRAARTAAGDGLSGASSTASGELGTADTAGELGSAGTGSTTGAGGATGARTASTVAGRVSASVSGAVVGARGGTVSVGIRYPNDSSGLVTGAGFRGINPGDSKAMAQAVVDDINGRGGIAGRKIAPLYYPFDVTASTAPGGGDSEQQKACAAFTEDNHVFGVVSPILSGTVLQQCLAKRGVVFVDENWNYFDGDISTDNYWDPAYPDPMRSVPALVDRLSSEGFFGAGSKIGAVYQDLPNRHPVLDKALKPALAKHGLKLDGTVAWTAENANALFAGVLQFKAAGITHVFVLDPGGLETFGWMAAAESQGYRPKYALDTRNYPVLQAGQSPSSQLANARGIGWIPSADVGVQPDKDLTPADRRCLGIVAKAGQDMSDPTNVRVALAYCDTLEFLKAAAGDASAVLSLASIKTGGEALGTRFTPTGTFAATFGPRRHDGAAAARDLVYDTTCTCFKYTGAVFSIG